MSNNTNKTNQNPQAHGIEDPVFAVPTKLPPNQGIHTIQVNAAREMFATTVRARGPPPTLISTTRPIDSKEPPVNNLGTFLPPNASRVSSKATPVSKPVHNQHQHNHEREIENLNIQVPAKNHNDSKCTNPQCNHCGTVIIPSPVASFPLEETPSISIGDWEIYTTKKPILNSDEIDYYTDILNLPLPEMIFGHNKVEIVNRSKNFKFNFNTIDSLKLVENQKDEIKEVLKVAHSEKWFESRLDKTEDVKEVLKPYDWTYATNYKGSTNLEFQPSEEIQIPLNKLKQPDPILFFDDMVLFEDELADNGISLLNVKIRVMPERLLILSRFFLRVDNVIFKIKDTRVFVEFKENLVIRSYKEQEAKYSDILVKVNPMSGDPRACLRDQNWIATKLPIIKEENEFIRLE
ncbi:hypothetical protein WICMUC_005599 [Wickerhamomyces mucosus]|uniref:Type 2A phosphatase activator TIP41 n=1 Tax=Wickerhamomyces mucosus TaxID=1378264 RepID=A0A9P8P7F5_9ASCO|nr:hypothetical protein WICMUC_005599 [Wickerhamomyces mucosus]